MQTFPSNTRLSRAVQRGFSLLELLTAVSIMVVIIFALYSMFAQTQKAMRANLTQVDVLESGRAAMEMITRELELIGACKLGRTTNLYAGMIPLPIPPLVQMDADEKRILRTNVLQEIFFLSNQTNAWVGTGYRIMQAEDGVGTLFRFSAVTNRHRLSYTNLILQFMNATLATNATTGSLSTNFYRVADGIVHFRLTAYDPEGRRLTYDGTNVGGGYPILRLSRNSGLPRAYSTANNLEEAGIILRQDPFDPYGVQTQLSFVSNALPAFIEFELGVLEPTTLKQYEAVAGTPVATGFLKKQAARVHLFRKVIPIRTALQ